MKNSLRTLCCALCFQALALWGAPVENMPFALGFTDFRSGDRIVIDRIASKKGTLAVGDKIVVTGRYVLASSDAAKLALYLNTTGPAKWVKTQPNAAKHVPAGEGQFSFEYEIEAPGYLHLAFYPARSGSCFGTLYFGTQQQMDAMPRYKHQN